MAYDNEAGTTGKSKEVDAIAQGAAKEVASNPQGFKVNSADPANTHQTNQGNVEDPAFSRMRKQVAP